jgi:hypothetical protein
MSNKYSKMTDAQYILWATIVIIIAGSIFLYFTVLDK